MEVLLGLGLGTALLICGVWYILQVIAYWKLFEKAGKPGWHSIIPILNTYDQFDICWNGIFGIIYSIGIGVTSYFSSQVADNQTLTIVMGVIGIVCLAIAVIGDYKLAKSFGRGFGTFLGLLFLPPIFMMILGFGDAQYVGKERM